MEEISIKKLEKQQVDEGVTGTVNTYAVIEGNREFVIVCTSHPHHGSSLAISGQEGTLHIQTEDNTVVRQIVALGGGCALALDEKVVDGLSPAALQAVIDKERSGKTG